RDLAYGPDLNFLTDLPNGAYDVTVTVGDVGQWAHDQMALSLEGTQVATLNTAAGEIRANTYRVTVNDGQLTLRLQDLRGEDPNAVTGGLAGVGAAPDTVGRKVIAASPTGTSTGPADRVTLTFDEPIQDGTFTLADVAALTGPAGAIAPTAVNKLSDTRYEV